MLELLAYAPEDGWAFVRKDEKITLIRPPYVSANEALTDESKIEPAIRLYGFTASRETFNNWDELISFLRSEILKSRHKQGRPLLEPGMAGKHLLELAPPEILMSFLERVEKELLPREEWDAAENVLMAMLDLPIEEKRIEIIHKATLLLKEMLIAKKRHQSNIETNLTIADEFPLAYRKYGKEKIKAYAAAIVERGTLLSFS
jgi:hypothetical protein